MRIILLLLLAASVFGQISNIRVDDVGHSSFRTHWDAAGGSSYANPRIYYGPTNAYGSVQYAAQTYGGNTNIGIVLSGLSTADHDAGRVVHFKVCSAIDGGEVCSADQTVTLSDIPAVHPVPATLPTGAVEIAPPSEAGCTTQTVAANLSDLQTILDSAIDNQPTVCQVVILPTGAVGSVDIVMKPTADADWVAVANVNVGANTIQPNAGNVYSDGMRVRVGDDRGPSWHVLAGGLRSGIDYCVGNYAAGVFTLSLWPECGAAVDITSAGTTGWYVMPYPPPNSKWITIRSNQTGLPPTGVRTSTGALSNAPKWQPSAVEATTLMTKVALRMLTLQHHVYIGPGIHFNAPTSNQTDTVDPMPWKGWVYLENSVSNVAVRGNVFTSLGTPERVYWPVRLDGSNIDFSDNHLTGMDFWKPYRTQTVTRTSASRITVSAGVSNTVLGNCTFASPQLFDISGGATGNVMLTVRQSDCTVVATSNATFTCSGGSCATQAGTDWPYNASGRFSQTPLAWCAYAAGSISACTARADWQINVEAIEATANNIMDGPGPLRIANNYYEGHGIKFHMDGSGGAWVIPRDVLFERNRFHTPESYILGHASNVAGLLYANRHDIECKQCERVLIKGNELSGSFAWTANQGSSILINGNDFGDGTSSTYTNAIAGDFTVESNYIHDVGSAFMFGGGPPDGGQIPKLGRRLTARNNLISNVNGHVYVTSNKGTAAYGACFELKAGGEDALIDHNTCYGAHGIFPGFFVASKRQEGLRITNNVFAFDEHNNYHALFIDHSGTGASSPDCHTVAGKAGWDCMFKAYTMSGNLFVPMWTNSQAQTGDSDAAAFSTSYGTLISGGTNYTADEGTVAARLTGRKWRGNASSNFRWKVDSPHISGGAQRAADGLDVGVDQDKLDDALGRVKNVRALSISASGATVYFHAPDSGTACYVGYGTGAVPTWTTSAANTAATQQRSIALTGLDAATEYSYQVWCSGVAPTATQTFRTL